MTRKRLLAALFFLFTGNLSVTQGESVEKKDNAVIPEKYDYEPYTYDDNEGYEDERMVNSHDVYYYEDSSKRILPRDLNQSESYGSELIGSEDVSNISGANVNIPGLYQAPTMERRHPDQEDVGKSIIKSKQFIDLIRPTSLPRGRPLMRMPEEERETSSEYWRPLKKAKHTLGHFRPGKKSPLQYLHIQANESVMGQYQKKKMKPILEMDADLFTIAILKRVLGICEKEKIPQCSPLDYMKIDDHGANHLKEHSVQARSWDTNGGMETRRTRQQASRVSKIRSRWRLRPASEAIGMEMQWERPGEQTLKNYLHLPLRGDSATNFKSVDNFDNEGIVKIEEGEKSQNNCFNANKNEVSCKEERTKRYLQANAEWEKDKQKTRMAFYNNNLHFEESVENAQPNLDLIPTREKKYTQTKVEVVQGKKFSPPSAIRNVNQSVVKQLSSAVAGRYHQPSLHEADKDEKEVPSSGVTESKRVVQSSELMNRTEPGHGEANVTAKVQLQNISSNLNQKQELKNISETTADLQKETNLNKAVKKEGNQPAPSSTMNMTKAEVKQTKKRLGSSEGGGASEGELAKADSNNNEKQETEEKTIPLNYLNPLTGAGGQPSGGNASFFFWPPYLPPPGMKGMPYPNMPFPAFAFPPIFNPNLPNMTPNMPNMVPNMPNMPSNMPNMPPNMPNMVPNMPNLSGPLVFPNQFMSRAMAEQSNITNQTEPPPEYPHKDLGLNALSTNQTNELITISIDPRTLTNKILHAEFINKTEENKNLETPKTSLQAATPDKSEGKEGKRNESDTITNVVLPIPELNNEYTSKEKVMENFVDGKGLSSIKSEPHRKTSRKKSNIASFFLKRNNISPETGEEINNDEINEKEELRKQDEQTSYQKSVDKENVNEDPGSGGVAREGRDLASNILNSGGGNDGGLTKVVVIQTKQKGSNIEEEGRYCPMLDRKCSNEECSEVPLCGRPLCYHSTLNMDTFKELNEGKKKRDLRTTEPPYFQNDKWEELCSTRVPQHMCAGNPCSGDKKSLQKREMKPEVLNLMKPVILLKPEEDETENDPSGLEITSLDKGNKKMENKILEGFINSIISNYSRGEGKPEAKKGAETTTVEKENSDSMSRIVKEILGKEEDTAEDWNIEPLIVPEKSISQFQNDGDYAKLGPFDEKAIRSLLNTQNIKIRTKRDHK